MRYKFGGLIFGGAYFRNFMVPKNDKITAFCQTKYVLEALHQSLPITKMNFEKLLHKANKLSKTTINCNSLLIFFKFVHPCAVSLKFYTLF